MLHFATLPIFAISCFCILLTIVLHRLYNRSNFTKQHRRVYMHDSMITTQSLHLRILSFCAIAQRMFVKINFIAAQVGLCTRRDDVHNCEESSERFTFSFLVGTCLPDETA